MKKAAVFLIKIYKKYISPFLPKSCRFYPTCSEYAMDAINKYGIYELDSDNELVIVIINHCIRTYRNI